MTRGKVQSIIRVDCDSRNVSLKDHVREEVGVVIHTAVKTVVLVRCPSLAQATHAVLPVAGKHYD